MNWTCGMASSLKRLRPGWTFHTGGTPLLADATGGPCALSTDADHHKATPAGMLLCSVEDASPRKRVQVPRSRSSPKEPSTPTFAGMECDSGGEQEPEGERELPEEILSPSLQSNEVSFGVPRLQLATLGSPRSGQYREWSPLRNSQSVE